jgi:hypothetical protein
MKWICLGLAWIASCAFASSTPEPTEEVPRVIVVVGAPGQPEYAQNFESWTKAWEKASATAGAKCLTIGLESPPVTNELEKLEATLQSEPKETSRELWLVLIGHGTFDGKQAKFNLRGPDLAATNLANLLEPFHRPLAIINTASASDPFLKALSAPGRVVITSTRSGYEQNYSRFGQYFSAAIADPKADLDKDGQVSLLEAFLLASHEVADFYKTQNRLATEHPLLDDNGDGLGTPPDWFRGIRAVKKAAKGAALDGVHAHQMTLIRSEFERKLSPALRARRNELEVKISQLRDAKDTMDEADYYRQLEALMLDLARLYASREAAVGPAGISP